MIEFYLSIRSMHQHSPQSYQRYVTRTAATADATGDSGTGTGDSCTGGGCFHR